MGVCCGCRHFLGVRAGEEGRFNWMAKYCPNPSFPNDCADSESLWMRYLLSLCVVGACPQTSCTLCSNTCTNQCCGCQVISTWFQLCSCFGVLWHQVLHDDNHDEHGIRRHFACQSKRYSACHIADAVNCSWGEVTRP